MEIFEIKINNKTTYTIDTEDYDKLTKYYSEDTTHVEILKAYEFVPQAFKKYVNDKCILSDLLNFLDYYRSFEEDLEKYYNDLLYPEEVPYLDEIIDFSDPEYFFETYFNSTYEAARATQFGQVNWFDDYIKFDGYGNLKSIPSIDFDDYAEEIIEQWLKEHFTHEVY